MGFSYVGEQHTEARFYVFCVFILASLYEIVALTPMRLPFYRQVSGNSRNLREREIRIYMK